MLPPEAPDWDPHHHEHRPQAADEPTVQRAWGGGVWVTGQVPHQERLPCCGGVHTGTSRWEEGDRLEWQRAAAVVDCGVEADKPHVEDDEHEGGDEDHEDPVVPN